MASTAFKRLMQEYTELTKNPPDGIIAGPISEDNFFEWEAMIQGPPGTDYESGVFKATMAFPDEYPNAPPKMKFVSEMWHPNVYPDGTVCISILHTPDPMNTQEREEETWRPIQTVESILVSVTSMLSDANFSSPANIDASVELRKKPEDYRKRVRRLAEKTRKELPEGFTMPKAKKIEAPKEEIFDYDEFEDDFEEDDEEMVEDEDEEGEEVEDEEEAEQSKKK